jgi:hypothetical protein
VAILFPPIHNMCCLKELFEDTKGVIRSRKSKDIQCNNNKNITKGQTITYKTLHRKLKIDHYESNWKTFRWPGRETSSCSTCDTYYKPCDTVKSWKRKGLYWDYDNQNISVILVIAEILLTWIQTHLKPVFDWWHLHFSKCVKHGRFFD